MTGENSGAFGDPSVVNGAGSYSVGNDNTIDGDNDFVVGSNNTIEKGSSAINVLGGSNNATGSNEYVTMTGYGNQVDGTTLTDVSGIKNQVSEASESNIQGYGNQVKSVKRVNVQGNNNTLNDAEQVVLLGNDNTALGGKLNNAQIIGNNVTTGDGLKDISVLGSNGTVMFDNSVVLGNASTDKQFVQVDDATVGTITYKGFAGKATGVVSVGNEKEQRQIVDVAAGEISASSTDAINGSQLYAIAAQAVAAQTHYYSVNSTNTAAGSNYANDGATGMRPLQQVWAPHPTKPTPSPSAQMPQPSAEPAWCPSATTLAAQYRL